jgi:hypothetical protein
MSRCTKSPSEVSSQLGAIALFLAALTSAGARAGEPEKFTAISPIFGQLVAFSQPSEFRVVFEQPTAERYIREAVLKSETAERWSQMITVTGAKGLAADPSIKPESFAGLLTGGFNQACPDTYATHTIGDLEIGGNDAFAAVASCGSVKSAGDSHGETALIVVIKGESDYYTIQWAERTAAASEPPVIDQDKWSERLEALDPIRLCTIVPGEKAPYPSCVDQDE